MTEEICKIEEKIPKPPVVKIVKIARPKMENLLRDRTRLILFLITASTTAVGMAFHRFHNERNKRIYREFYEKYDIEKAFESMASKGLFHSVPKENFTQN